jgi:hypothetical protein
MTGFESAHVKQFTLGGNALSDNQLVFGWVNNYFFNSIFRHIETDRFVG